MCKLWSGSILLLICAGTNSCANCQASGIKLEWCSALLKALRSELWLHCPEEESQNEMGMITEIYLLLCVKKYLWGFFSFSLTAVHLGAWHHYLIILLLRPVLIQNLVFQRLKNELHWIKWLLRFSSKEANLGNKMVQVKKRHSYTVKFWKWP